MNSLPSLSLRVSVSGLKFRVPARDMATTRSGEVTKEWVAGLLRTSEYEQVEYTGKGSYASFLPVKLRL